MLSTFVLNTWYLWLLRKDHVPQTWVLLTSMTVLQQPIGPVEILGTRWSLPLPLLPSTISSDSLFLSYLKINKYKIACDSQDVYQCYRAHRSSSLSVPPFGPPHRGIVPRSPENRRTRATWSPMWLSGGFYKGWKKRLLTKICYFLETERSRSEVFFPNLKRTHFLVKDFVKYCSI